MALAYGHDGVWTVDEVLAMPDDGTRTRYEVLDGVLLVTPAPGYEHQRASLWIANALQQAADIAGARVEVIEGLNFRIPDGLFIPDVLVVDGAVAVTAPDVLSFTDVLAVVEIESPSSRRIDRQLKSSAYAEAGVPTYWRVELEPAPAVVVSTLDNGCYRQVCTAVSGTTTTIPLPYTVALDPSAMVTPPWSR